MSVDRYFIDLKNILIIVVFVLFLCAQFCFQTKIKIIAF
jgi:hypothetical protein